MPMPMSGIRPTECFLVLFLLRWCLLQEPHVRALAWLLDAPDLLDSKAPRWQGKIASLQRNSGERAASWLAELDRAPAALHAYLDVQAFSRLGRYAEKLLAFYFEHLGFLVAHGLQVRSENNRAIGEFDFLLYLF